MPFNNLSYYENSFPGISIQHYLPIKNRKVKFRIQNKFYTGTFIHARTPNREYYSQLDDRQEFKNNLHPYKTNVINFASIKHYFHLRKNQKISYIIIQQPNRQIYKIVGSYERGEYIVFCDIPNYKLISQSAKNNYHDTIRKMFLFANLDHISTAHSIVDLAIKITHDEKTNEILSSI